MVWYHSLETFVFDHECRKNFDIFLNEYLHFYGAFILSTPMRNRPNFPSLTITDFSALTLKTKHLAQLYSIIAISSSRKLKFQGNITSKPSIEKTHRNLMKAE